MTKKKRCDYGSVFWWVIGQNVLVANPNKQDIL